jgi:hypothetical protein
MIAKEASSTWNDGTQVERWLRADPRSNATHDKLIRKVFTRDPAGWKNKLK